MINIECLGSYPVWNAEDAAEYGEFSVKFRRKGLDDKWLLPQYAFFKSAEAAASFALWMSSKKYINGKFEESEKYYAGEQPTYISKAQKTQRDILVG